MDSALFVRMLHDEKLTDLRKLGYKYPEADLAEFVSLLKEGFYTPLPLKDFSGNPAVYMENAVNIALNTVKILLAPSNSGRLYGLKAMEEEISSTLLVENIDSSRESVRRILYGYAPQDDSENRILGLKRGLDYISDPEKEITEENLQELYKISIGQYLDQEDRLPADCRYRNDDVFVIGSKVEHTGLPWNRLEEYMAELVGFIREENGMNELLKAAVIHFYIAYLHPYFDGNGRMARLVHLWYLVRRGYSSVLFIPMSEYIQGTRKEYYSAYTLTERNYAISGVLDLTPFLSYFAKNVYSRLKPVIPGGISASGIEEIMDRGGATEKERALWRFVLSAYGTGEFSTKQLEKDFGNAAYATIRGFVLKFKALSLLEEKRYGSRVKYFLINS